MDEELEAIRQARLAELQKRGANGASSGSPSSGAGGGNGSAEHQQQLQEDEVRQSMLSQILTNEARERLSRIRIVRGDRARAVEDYLMRMARSGQLRSKISEPELVSLLDQISQQQSKANSSKIIFNRHSDDEEDVNIPATTSTHDDSEDDFFD